MKNPGILRVNGARVWFAFLFLALGIATLPAQNATGRITGRVFNPATRDYVRNAQVRIEGTERVVETESDGSFRFDDVPAGEVTLAVTYTGYTAAPERLTLTAGQTAVREINLVSTLALAGERKPGEAGQPLQLQQFIVSSAR